MEELHRYDLILLDINFMQCADMRGKFCNDNYVKAGV